MAKELASKMAPDMAAFFLRSFGPEAPFVAGWMARHLSKVGDDRAAALYRLTAELLELQ